MNQLRCEGRGALTFEEPLNLEFNPSPGATWLSGFFQFENWGILKWPLGKPGVTVEARGWCHRQPQRPPATGLQAGPLQPGAPLCLSATRRRITTPAVHRVQMLSKGPGGGGRTMLQRLMKSWEPRCQIPAASRGRCLSASGPACLSSQVCSRPRGSQPGCGLR